MLERVKSFIRYYNLQEKTIIVGFSGGYDSMCLLDILSKIKSEQEFFDLEVIAAHFNHNWRGDESLKEQEVCRLFATSKGFEFFTKTAPAELKKTENDARIARYEFFEEVCENYDADAVLTGDVDLYAKWRAHVLTIRYKIRSGETIRTDTGANFKKDLQ